VLALVRVPLLAADHAAAADPAADPTAAADSAAATDDTPAERSTAEEKEPAEGGEGEASRSAAARFRWLERPYEGDPSSEEELSRFAAAIPTKLSAEGEDAEAWFVQAEGPPAIVARRASQRARGRQRADEASRRAEMAREEEAYAKSLFAADDEGGGEDGEDGEGADGEEEGGEDGEDAEDEAEEIDS
jgi:hypothetical protein